MILRARQFEYRFPRPSLVMGILNVTPDSFSDGGIYADTDKAVAHGIAMYEEGADWLDVGGESTRPNATPVSADEELRRVLPVIERLRRKTKAIISIDTMKPKVARAAIQAGASVVNDVAAASNGKAMWDVILETGAAYVVMHMQGSPATMQKAPHYENAVGEIGSFFEQRLEALRSHGIAAEQLILDVGVGFGKTLDHNLQLLGHLGRYQAMGRPMMLGVSRKAFMGKLLGAEVNDRLPAALACTIWARLHGAQICRTHDVAATHQALRMVEALQEEAAHAY